MRIPGLKTLNRYAWLVRSRLVKHGLILGYHRVNDLSWDPFRLAVSPEHFSQQLQILAKHTNVLSLDELTAACTRGQIPPRSVAITFDDGYGDFMSIAKPLLKRTAFHSTLFVSTGYLGREFWWDTLTRVVKSLNPSDALTLGADSSTFAWPSPAGVDRPDQRALLGALYRFLLPLETKERTRCLVQLAESAQSTASVGKRDLAFTESEIMELAADDLVTIGCHTVTHPMLAQLPVGQQREEIIRSKQVLGALTGQPVRGFSFPNGSTSATSIDLVQECGFAYACASHKDIVWRNSNPFCLPRIWVPDCAGDSFLRLLRRWL